MKSKAKHITLTKQNTLTINNFLKILKHCLAKAKQQIKDSQTIVIKNDNI